MMTRSSISHPSRRPSFRGSWRSGARLALVASLVIGLVSLRAQARSIDGRLTDRAQEAARAEGKSSFSSATEAAAAAVPGRGRHLNIYGGWESSTDEYPFGATLVHKSLLHVCSGSLIAPGVVLTAAHCLSDHDYVYSADNDFAGSEHLEEELLSSYRVVLGRDMSGDHAMEDTVGITKIVVGEPFAFYSGSAQWDLALVFLDTCQGRTFQPVKIFEGNGTAAAEGFGALSVIGWGDTERQCVSHHRSVDRIDPMMEMLYGVVDCAADGFCRRSQDLCDARLTMCLQEDNVASCDGDSGGPVFMRVPVIDTNPVVLSASRDEGEEGGGEEERFRRRLYEYVQVGILSAGNVRRVEDHRVPGHHFVDEARAVYLAGYSDWLREHLAGDACLHESNLTVDDLFWSKE